MKTYKNTEDLSLGERIKYLRKENNLLQMLLLLSEFAVLLVPIMNVDFLYQAFPNL